MTASPGLFHPRDFLAFTPVIVLAVWGLAVLLADVLWLRKRGPEARREAVGRFALVAVIVSFVVTLVPLINRFDLYGLRDYLNFARIDYLSDPDPYLFMGTVSCDLMTDLIGLLIAAGLVLVVWLSRTWSFTEEWGEYYALLIWSTVGMMLLAASEDMLLLFLTLEMMTICLYLVTALEKTRRRSAEGGLKYFVYGSVSSALFLFGLSLLYGLTGSTQFYAIRQALLPGNAYAAGLSGNIAGSTAVLLLLVGFGFKIAAVPFHQWAPDAYEGAPAPVTAWIATGSKVASFIALMKVLLYALAPWANGLSGVTSPGWIGVVAVLSALSMTYGNFAALAQKNFKRMLAYSSIAHAGYMLVGVAAAGQSGKQAESAGSVLFYLVSYSVSNLGAFALAGWLARDKGSDEIEDLNGLAKTSPALATSVLLIMLSLVGLPPLAGFFGKLYMFMEALDQSGLKEGRLSLLWLVALGLFNSVVSAFYYVRVLKAMFLREPSGQPLGPPPTAVSVTIYLAAAVALGLGLSPAPVVNAMRAAAIPMLSESPSIGRSGVSTKTLPGAPPPLTPMEELAKKNKEAGLSPFQGASAGGGPAPAAKNQGDQPGRTRDTIQKKADVPKEEPRGEAPKADTPRSEQGKPKA